MVKFTVTISDEEWEKKFKQEQKEWSNELLLNKIIKSFDGGGLYPKTTEQKKCVIKTCNNSRFDECCYGMCRFHCSEKKHHYLENGKMKYPNIREKTEMGNNG